MKPGRQLVYRLAALGWLPTLALVGLLWARESRAAEQARTPIKVTRLFTGPDNKTHVEEYEVPLGAPNGAYGGDRG